jgi:hypothetical protein
MTVARRVVEQAIGEKLDGTPLEDLNAGKNPRLSTLLCGYRATGRARLNADIAVICSA